jgi:photosystem II stability/assembly factor-like uncharacterized protein
MLRRPSPSLARCLLLLLVAMLAAGSAPAQTRAKPARKGPTPGIPQQAKPKYKGVFEPVNYEQPIEFLSVFFVDAKTGWVAGGHGTILRTRDAGKTWEAQMGGDPENDEQPFNDLYFIDQRQGWVVGPTKSVVQRKLFTTSDGGESWRPAGTVGSVMGGYSDYAFTSATNGVFLTKNGQIFQTSDGGKKWREVLAQCEVQTEVEGIAKREKCLLKSVRFVSASVGYAAGAAPGGTAVVMKTQNAGASWDYVYVQPDIGHPDESYFKQSVFFLDERTGYLVLPRAKKILKTTDGGESWEELTATAQGELRFADPEVGWVMEAGKWAYTTDGGKHWGSREVHFPVSPQAFSLPTRQRGYVAGASGMIYRYSVVPADYSAERAIEVPAMTGAGAEQMTERIAKVRNGVDALRAKLQAAQKKGGTTAARGSAATAAGAGAKQRPATGSARSAGSTSSAATSGSDEGSASSAGATEAEPSGDAEAGSEGAGGDELAGEASDAGDGGFVQDCCPEQLKEVASSVESATAELPKFTGKFRNLNLFSVGLQMFQGLLNQGKEMKAAFAELRQAKDPETAMAALNKLSGSADGMTKSVAGSFGGAEEASGEESNED